MSSNHSLETLTDQALIGQFGDLVQQDQRRTAALLRHIDAIDRRQLWAKYGHPSLFDFCVSRFHMSESTAGKRIGAARTARRFPLVFDMVARGEIHLSGIHRLKAHLTPANHECVLAQAKHKTIRELEQLVVRLAPRPDVPSTLRTLPQRRSGAHARPVVPATSPASVAPSPPSPPTAMTIAAAEPPRAPASPAIAAPRRAPDPEPLSPGRYRLQVTLDATAYQKLRQLQDLLAHQIPNSDPAVIIGRAFDALLAHVQKSKAGITSRPRARKLGAARRARWIPLAIRRQVWTRDQGRCSFVGADGHRCNETRGLEFAHVEAWAKGGEHSADNLCLRCRAHNAWEADRDFGAGFMATKRGQPWNVREPVARYAMRVEAPATDSRATRLVRASHGPAQHLERPHHPQRPPPTSALVLSAAEIEEPRGVTVC